MKFFITLVLMLNTPTLSAQNKMEDKKKNSMLKISKDLEREENIKRIFFDKLDDTSVLSSFSPDFVDMRDLEGPEDDMVTVGGFYNEMNQTRILPGFMFERPVSPVATILSGFDGEEHIPSMKSGYIKIETEVEINKIYSVIRYVRRVKNPDSRNRLYYYQYLGDGTIREIENRKRAVIRMNSSGYTAGGDFIVPQLYPERRFDIRLLRRKPFHDRALILGVGEDGEMAGEGDFLFLNKGSTHGLVKNQILNIYMDPDAHDLKEKNKIPIGILQLLDVSPTVSTGYILTCQRDVRVGDYAMSE